MKLKFTAHLIFISLFFSHLVFANDSPPLSKNTLLKRTFTTMPTDFDTITTYPFYHPKPTGIALLTVAGLIAVDKDTTQFIQQNFNRWFDFSLPTLINTPYTKGADGYLALGIAGLYVFSNLSHHSQRQVAALLATKSAAYSVIYTEIILKSLLGRVRPNPNLNSSYIPPGYTNNPWDFTGIHAPRLGSASNSFSMPSFHFTLYFAAATTLHDVYHSWFPYAVVLFGLIPNFSGHHHWVSDMVAGGLMGSMIGHMVYDNYANGLQEKLIGLPGEKAKIEFVPYVTNHAIGAQCSFAI